MKEEKGITLLTLTITIVILLILTFTIGINAPDLLHMRRKSNFENDMNSLKEEIDQYYARYDGLPIINKYTNISMLSDIKNVNDNENYYVIDLSKISVNLNYGKDYETVKAKDISEEISDVLDLYIINEESHTIYYPKGIEYNDKINYTLDTYTMIKEEGYVNKPKLLEGMTPIKFTEATQTAEGQTITTNKYDENWYNYTSKKWANAKTKDGSMWVWIPRFAYKITYYTDDTKQTISNTKTSYGSIDVVFLIGTTDNYYDENGSIKTAQRQKTSSQTINSTLDYTVHPAFTDESSINYANGGWNKELTGIWVAKFEAGYASGGNTATVKASNVNYTQTTSWVWKTEAGTTNDSSQPARNWLDGVYAVKNADNTYSWKDEKETAIKYPVFQGSTYSMNYINHNDAFRISKVLTDRGNIYGLSNTNADSHLMKNSEWGAVAYLSKSKYGLGNTDIAVNKKSLNNSVTSVYAVTGYNENNNKWNEYIGTNLSASTTGNIYGIYDMSGGTYERTAGIVSNGNGNLYTYGKAIIDEAKVTYTVNEETGAVTVNRNTGASTKYVTIYPNNDENESDINTASQNNYEANTSIYGDAIRETSTAGTGATSWYGDDSYFPALSVPFFPRGGYWGNGSSAGLFSFHRFEGYSDYWDGFRAVLVAL